jgi:hypothetical protein
MNSNRNASPHRTPRWYAVFPLVALLASFGCTLPKNLEVSSTSIPLCESSADEAWTRIVSDFLEVEGTTPEFLELGAGNAERGGGGGGGAHDNIWIPVTGFKAAVSGLLQGQSFQTSDDFDWNLDVGVDPSTASQERIDEFRQRFDPASFGKGKFPRVHCEVSPESTFPDRAGFWGAQLAIMDEGRVGAFGPWVADRNPDHDSDAAIPELHPAEMTWWRQTVGPKDSIFWLLLMQDSINQYNKRESYYSGDDHRNRFRQRDFFDFDGRPEPPGWRPWAKGPIHAQYRVAFEVLVNEPPVRFWIVPQTGLEVRPAPVPDMDDGLDHRLIVDGREILRATEVVDDHLTAVNVSGLCQTATGSIRGFLEVATAAGVAAPDDRGGYHFLAVIRNGGTPTPLRPGGAGAGVLVDGRDKPPAGVVPVLDAWLEATPEIGSHGAPAAWSDVVAEVGLPAGTAAPGDFLCGVLQWDVALRMDYGRKDEEGRIHLEDAPPFAASMARNALASARVDWSIATVPPDAAHVEVLMDETPQGNMRIRFADPTASRLVKVRVTARVKDGRGGETETSLDLWNRMLASSDRAAMESTLLPWLEGVHGTSAAEPGSRASLLRLRMQDRTGDSRVTVEELRSLVTTGKVDRKTK